MGKRLRCHFDGAPIPAERLRRAKESGAVARWCSPTCEARGRDHDKRRGHAMRAIVARKHTLGRLPMQDITPEVLRERIASLGTTAYAVSGIAGLAPATISHFFHGRRRLTDTSRVRLELALLYLEGKWKP